MPSPVLRNKRLILRKPHRKDRENWIDLRRKNRFFLQPWEPKWDVDSPTLKAFKRQLTIYKKGWDLETAHSFFITHAENSTLMGGITLGHIRYGIAQSASIGYWIGQEFSRLGYMSDALQLIAKYAFTVLRLNRLEACCLPNNIPSISLLEKNDFTREGLARQLMEINGEYEDHYVFSMLYSDFEKTIKVC